jgi:uncharacterized protein DUF1844
MSDEKKPFTVSDRRHFTAEGHTRDETAGQEDAPAPPAKAPPPSEDRESRRQSAAPPEGGPPPTLDFAGLLLSLGAQASLLLGLAGEDEADEPPDLEGAQAIITLLEVLREKTEGRRTEDEERILQGILYELRMAYVSRARVGGA